MTLCEALETNRPLRRKSKGVTYKSFHPNGTVGVTEIARGKWIDPEFMFTVKLLSREDILAHDWTIKVEGTK